MLPQLIAAAAVGAAVAALTAIVLLGSRRPVINALAFLAGWTLVLLVLASLLQLAFGGHPLQAAGIAPRGTPPAEPTGPAWLRRVQSLHLVGAFVVGMVAIAVSPADVAVYMSAIQALIGSDFAGAKLVVTWVVLLICIDSCILVPLLVYIAMPRRADWLLAAGQRWIIANQRKVTGWSAAVFGVVLIVNALVSL